MKMEDNVWTESELFEGSLSPGRGPSFGFHRPTRIPSFRAKIPAKYPAISRLHSGIGPDSR